MRPKLGSQGADIVISDFKREPKDLPPQEVNAQWRIINIASDAAKRAKPKTAAYTTSKFAVIGLTQASALDLAPHRITVNAVCPGSVNTDRLNY